MVTSAQIRSVFLNFFASQGHQIVQAGPLIPDNDPSLLFTNSGMVQFKNVFTGVENRPYSRAVSAQKCLRAGGKHNDLENVGYTRRHHTFFEMLGNFSFGDYFKETAIALAWTLITKEFALPQERLLVTVYAEDQEAFDLWQKIAGLDSRRVIKIPTEDNFWRMGENGPCGPCSEIFYDYGPELEGGPPGSAEADGDRFVEIWNLVFMQFEQTAKQLIPLRRPCIDTGMGLERIASILQGKTDNYNSDILQTLMNVSGEVSGTDPEGEHRTAHRVIVDHLRAAAFLISQGVLPSNDGRGYVLRRIIRRAIRHIHKLGVKEPLLAALAPTLLDLMGQAYPELSQAQALITETLRYEELRFSKTLERGLRLLDEELQVLPKGESLSGQTAFKLYDTYGFPLDLTEDVLRQQGYKGVDRIAFSLAMEQQRKRAREAWSGSSVREDGVWFDLEERCGTTEFLGYESLSIHATVCGLVIDGVLVDQAKSGAEVGIVVNQTPFYGESGGQIGDSGRLESLDSQTQALIHNTQKKRGCFIHYAAIAKGILRLGMDVELSVNRRVRAAVAANHTATHLLHYALRSRLGSHVHQKGSLVAAERLRFDVSRSKPITVDERKSIEDTVNELILANHSVTATWMSLHQARAQGALALFGEKYLDQVRVVSIGDGYSQELCGGTHVSRTGSIGLFKIVQEGAVAAGIRRLEAITGLRSLEYLRERQTYLESLSTQLKTPIADLRERVASLLQAPSSQPPARQEEFTVNQIPLVIHHLHSGTSSKELKAQAARLKKQIGSGIIGVTAVEEKKVSLVVGVTEDLTERYNALDIVKKAAVYLGGKSGGGRADLAQSGGNNPSSLPQAIESIKESLRRPLTDRERT